MKLLISSGEDLLTWAYKVCEHIGSVLLLDEAEPLGLIEPLDSAHTEALSVHFFGKFVLELLKMLKSVWCLLQSGSFDDSRQKKRGWT